mmetsp:Transcript_42201/g.139847  ORF Transcript_42201/g.139847 Transcript_42201/m.139847 type:complete len:526 (+) Transcript_42201:88-1665(+)
MFSCRQMCPGPLVGARRRRRHQVCLQVLRAQRGDQQRPVERAGGQEADSGRPRRERKGVVAEAALRQAGQDDVERRRARAHHHVDRAVRVWGLGDAGAHHRRRQLQLARGRKEHLVGRQDGARIVDALGDEQVRRAVERAQVNLEAGARAGARGKRDGDCGQGGDDTAGKLQRADGDAAGDGARPVVFDVAGAALAAHRDHVRKDGARVQVVQWLPPPAEHLARDRGAVLERAPAARRPDLVELPHQDAELVPRAARLDVGLDVERLGEEALVELPPEDRLAGGVEVARRRASKVDLDHVVARVVALRHHILPLAPPLEAAAAVVAALARVEAPVLGRERRSHRLERGHGDRAKLGGKHVRVRRAGGRRVRQLDRQVGREESEARGPVDGGEAAAVLVGAVRLDARARLRRDEGAAGWERVEQPHAAAPARGGARGPHRTRRVLARHHGHHECGVHTGGRPHHHLALVAPVPHRDRRVAREAAHRVPQLRLLRRGRLWRMARLGVLHVVVHEQAACVARVVKRVG